MAKRILITGGAGFIGSHLADALLDRGYSVRALDLLAPQVHGKTEARPDYLNEDVELVVGDVRDRAVVDQVLDGVDAVFHFAAAVGVGQSMYEIEQYTSVNNLGTAVLLQALLKRPVQRLVVASSMSVYGEGRYRSNGTVYGDVERSVQHLRRGHWEPMASSGDPLIPLATPETKPPILSSIYALSKYDQERMCMMIGTAYGFDAVALRFFNVYGTRQALSNPYTGVLAIFASQLLNDKPPLVFEDGNQRRDFVSVHDVVQACTLALEVPEAAGEVFNVGSGKSFTIIEIAERLARVIGKPHLQPEVTGKYRVGDIRHCYADISKARQILGYEPRVSLDDGLRELAAWLDGMAANDGVGEAYSELHSRGLAV